MTSALRMKKGSSLEAKTQFRDKDEIKRDVSSTLDDMPNFEMDSAYLDETVKKEIKLEPLV